MSELYCSLSSTPHSMPSRKVTTKPLRQHPKDDGDGPSPSTRAMSSLPVKSSTPSFFSLPREVRDMIYHLLLGGEEEYCQSLECLALKHLREPWRVFYGEEPWPTCDHFNIAQTSRTANEEANEVIYRNNKFQFHLMSKIWINPQISQINANYMQNIHVILGSDEKSRPKAIHFLKKFTLSQVVRQKCRIQLELDHPKDITKMLPVFRVIAAFTAFRTVIIDVAEESDSSQQWHTPAYNEARAVWTRLRKRLESKMGKAMYEHGPSFRHLKFKPREYLVQQDLSH